MTSGNRLWNTSYPELGALYRGKVRDCYVADGVRYLVATDRISAFDVVFDEPVLYKGRVLNELSRFFLEKAASIVPTAYLSSPHPNVIVAKECKAYPVEMIVRAYLSGSAWVAYHRGERSICGVELPEGLSKNSRLPSPILTPTTKSDTGHDEPVTRGEILRSGMVPADQYQEMERMSLALFEQGSRYAAECGLILVDTKYEFGTDENGAVLLIDEVHTPDSSRYFYADSYQDDPERPHQLSKEFLREWLRDQGYTGQAEIPKPRLPRDLLLTLSQRYLELYRVLVGEEMMVPKETIDLELEIFHALRREGHLRGYVAIVVAGSLSDRGEVDQVTRELAEFGIPCLRRIVSAHRDPLRALELVKWADRYPGDVVWVDVTGLSNAKGPMISASTLNPVYHCSFEPLGADLLSSLNLPSGVPLALVAKPKNLALVVAKQLGTKYPEIRGRIEQFFARNREAGLKADRAFTSLIRPELS